MNENKKKTELLNAMLVSLVNISIQFKVTRSEMRLAQLILVKKNLTAISSHTGKSVKTLSAQKASLFKKLSIKNDVDFVFFLLTSIIDEGRLNLINTVSSSVNTE